MPSHQPCAPSQEASPETPAMGQEPLKHLAICQDPPGPSWAQEQTTQAAPTNPALGALLGREHMDQHPEGRALSE